MAYYYTDVAANQKQGVNFPGTPGAGTLTTQPGTQNRALFEGPPFVLATYTWANVEAANDIINICILPAGTVVDAANAKVCSGLTAPNATLTLAIGDNDLAVATLLPIPNPTAVVSQAGSGIGTGGPYTAPSFVANTTYVYGNVVTDPNSTPANLTYTCVTSTTSAATAPHSAANTVWMPNNQRYSNSISVAAASGAVAFSGGTQFYGGPMSILPASVSPGTAPSNVTGAQILNQQYVIQQDCWLQALILTINTTAINANAVSVFRVPLIAAN